MLIRTQVQIKKNISNNIIILIYKDQLIIVLKITTIRCLIL